MAKGNEEQIPKLTLDECIDIVNNNPCEYNKKEYYRAIAALYYSTPYEDVCERQRCYIWNYINDPVLNSMKNQDV